VKRGVGPGERIRDAVALAILVAGAALWGYGFLGLRRMAWSPIVPEHGRTAVQRTTLYWNVSRAGVALILVGLIAVAWSFWRHHARRDELS
jgi:hypothetical protein